MPLVNVSNEQLELFTKILHNDLTEYAKLLSSEHNIPLENITKEIPKILEKPLHSKIISNFLNTNNLTYKKDLNRYTLNDLKEIAKNHGLKTTGKKTELIDRISISLNLKDFTTTEINDSKSFISKPFKKHSSSKEKKKKISNIVYDSD